MKSFLLIGAFVCLAAARPEGSSDEARTSLNVGEYLPPYGNNPSNFPLDNGNGLNGLGGGQGGFTPGIFNQQQQLQPLVNKQLYLYSAPEEESVGQKHFVLGRPQKNYRVVFVKAPATGPTRLSAEYAPQDEKTVIYVLSQKEHEIDPADIATPAPTEPSKPEVFFIKYKTPEEASLAQRQIQAQYDALGGTSEVSDEGILPVTSVERARGGYPGGSSNNNNGYLPPGF